MSSSVVETAPRAIEVSSSEDELIVHLADGRRIIIPLAWFPRLLNASQEQRDHYRLIGNGEYINWPDIDEDLTVSGLLRGTRSPEGQTR